MAEVLDPKQTNKPPSPLTGGNAWSLSNSTTLDLLRRMGVSNPVPLDTDAVCKPGEPSTPRTYGIVSAAPPKSVIGEIKAAYWSSYTPIQFLELATKNVTNLGMENARGVLSPAADKSLTSTFIDAAKAVTYVASFDFMRSGDKRFSQDMATHIEKSLDRNGKPIEFGDYDIMMAAGWQPKDPIKVNGVMKTLDKPVDNMLAVFVRNKNGEVELLEPSHKMTELKQVNQLWSAVMGDAVTASDKRWQETAGTHVIWQILPMVASGGAWAIGRTGTFAATKLPQLEKVVETGAKAATLSAKLSAPLAAVSGGSGISTMAGELSQGFIISPKAIRDLADGISNLMNDPKGITEAGVRKSLNNALHEYTFNQGPDAKQIYIPSLNGNDSPWERLQYSLQGIVSAHQKSNHPWEKWSLVPRRGDVPEIRDALVKHPGVTQAFYTSIEKHLAGKPLTDQDIFVLRVGVNLGPVMSENMSPAGKNGLKFTPEEKKETLRVVNEQLNWRVLDKLKGSDTDPAVEKKAIADAKKLGIDREEIDPGKPQFTAAQIKAFVTDEVKAVGAIIQTEREFEARKNAAKVTALGMGL